MKLKKFKIFLKKKLLKQKKNEKIEETKKNIQNKLIKFQNLYSNKQQIIQFGKKLKIFIKDYLSGKSKKEIFNNFMKILEKEKYKSIKKNFTSIIQNNKKEIKQKFSRTRIQKEIEKTIQSIKSEVNQKEIELIKIGTKVRITGSSSIGCIERIEGENILVNYGIFTVKVNIKKLKKV